MRRPRALIRSLAGAGNWLDVAVCLLLLTGVVLYLARLPHNLGVADESYFLNHARRIREGQLLYRDIFYYVTPGSYWLMASLFWLFGTDIAVARLATAVIHACTAVLVYLASRSVGAPRPLALSAGVAEIALCQPAWPYASYHWPATLLMTSILLTVLRASWTDSTRWAMVPGLLVGALIACQQQKGAAMALGVGAFFLLNGLLARRYGAPPSWHTAWRQVGWAATGAGLIVLLLLAVLLASAGFSPVFDQLVRLPLTGYRAINQDRSSWGAVGVFSTQLTAYTFPTVLTYLPIITIPAAVRAAAKWFRRSDARGFERLLALTVLCSAAALATAYKADFIHIALIAPLFLVFWAEGLAAAMLHLPAGRSAVWSWCVGSALLVWMAVHLDRNLERAHQEYPVSDQTPFGRIDFATEGEVQLVERIRGLMRDVPTREFFAYPMYASLYLTTGTNNPTPHEVMIPEYNSPAQYEEVAEILRQRQLPYVLACFVSPGTIDPVLRYIDAHYERMGPSNHPCGLYQRRDLRESPDRPAPGASSLPMRSRSAYAGWSRASARGRKPVQRGPSAPSTLAVALGGDSRLQRVGAYHRDPTRHPGAPARAAVRGRDRRRG